MPPSWTNVTDPTLVWDARGRVHHLVLAYNAFWGTVEQPNGGRPVEAGPELSVDSATFLDKPWITASPRRSGPRSGHVYGAWVLFTETGAGIHTAVSRNRGASWSAASKVPTPQELGPKNPWPMIAVGADGVVHLSYVSYGTASADGTRVPATIWSARPTDDGRTWGGVRQGRQDDGARQLHPARYDGAPHRGAVPLRQPGPQDHDGRPGSSPSGNSSRFCLTSRDRGRTSG